MEDICFKNESPFFQCCCECVNHLEDYSHPLTYGKSVLKVRGFRSYITTYRKLKKVVET